MRHVKRMAKGASALAGLAMLVLLPLKAIPLMEQLRGERRDRARMHVLQAEPEAIGELVRDTPDTLCVSQEAFDRMGMTLAQVQPPMAPEPLKLDGFLFLPSDCVARIHSRFAGTVVAVGFLEDRESRPGSQSLASVEAVRPLQFGDTVHKGQLLAAVQSKELGEKKSELVEALARLRIDRERLERLLAIPSAIPPDKIRQQRRLVEADVVSVERAEHTLRTWHVADAEIDAMHAEAQRLHKRTGKERAVDESWARMEIRSPIDGLIVEKNFALGDSVYNFHDFCKIADVSRLQVVAHAIEEELAILDRLHSDERAWSVHLKSDPHTAPFDGRFDRIGKIIDPIQRTAPVLGWIDNPHGRLRVGQFITATVARSPADTELSIPASAVLDLDGKYFVFVRSATYPTIYSRLRVFPVRRRNGIVTLDCRSHRSEYQNAGEVALLKVGDWVVANGAMQLASELLKYDGDREPRALADLITGNAPNNASLRDRAGRRPNGRGNDRHRADVHHIE